MKRFRTLLVIAIAFVVVFSVVGSVGLADEQEPTWLGWFTMSVMDALFDPDGLPSKVYGALVWVYEGMQRFFCWVANILFDLIDWVFSFVFPEDSDALEVDEETVAQMFSIAYAWVPIDTIIAVLTAVFSCRLAVWCVNFVLMFVPGL